MQLLTGRSICTGAGEHEAENSAKLEGAMGKNSRHRASATQSIFPINQLPREILAQIFWHCVLENTDVDVEKQCASFIMSRLLIGARTRAGFAEYMDRCGHNHP